MRLGGGHLAASSADVDRAGAPYFGIGPGYGTVEDEVDLGRGIAVFEPSQRAVDLGRQEPGEDLRGVQCRGVEQISSGGGEGGDVIEASIRGQGAAGSLEVWHPLL